MCKKHLVYDVFALELLLFGRNAKARNSPERFIECPSKSSVCPYAEFAAENLKAAGIFQIDFL
jgi:hypothetical protein